MCRTCCSRVFLFAVSRDLQRRWSRVFMTVALAVLPDAQSIGVCSGVCSRDALMTPPLNTAKLVFLRVLQLITIHSY